jgi:CRP/FNR family cyclic AMP-dependent transcriptional regulator
MGFRFLAQPNWNRICNPMENPTEPINCDDELLTKFKIFAELSQDELKTLVEQSTRVSHPTGHRIITKGEPGFCMFVILSGSTRVTAETGPGEVELATLKPGDFFGEVALVDDGPRSADVTALEPCELLCITRMTLGVLAGLQPGAAIQILAAIGRCLVERIRTGNQKYMDLILLGRQSA